MVASNEDEALKHLQQAGRLRKLAHDFEHIDPETAKKFDGIADNYEKLATDLITKVQPAN